MLDKPRILVVEDDSGIADTTPRKEKPAAL
jgi:hypothetical protein